MFPDLTKPNDKAWRAPVSVPRDRRLFMYISQDKSISIGSWRSPELGYVDYFTGRQIIDQWPDMVAWRPLDQNHIKTVLRQTADLARAEMTVDAQRNDATWAMWWLGTREFRDSSDDEHARWADDGGAA